MSLCNQAISSELWLDESVVNYGYIMDKYIVGLTGGIGSGKTAVSNYLAQLGVDVVDADVIAHKSVSHGTEALSQIHQRYGDDILLDDGSLNRSALRNKVFNNEDERLWLEGLLHPLIRQTLLSELEAVQSHYGLLVAPLLLENGLDQYCQRVLIVDVPEELQIERSMLRDGSDEANIKSIIEAQIPRTERLQKADDVVLNDQSLDHLYQQVQAFHEQYMSLSRLHKQHDKT